MTEKPIKTALIIDDEEFDQRMYRRTIERSGLVEELVSFIAADHAIAHLSTQEELDIDVIFLDINMPRMDGFEFLEEATKLFGPRFARVCIVMLTTSLNPRDKERAEEFEVVKDFLNKPLTVEQLSQVADMVNELKVSAT